MTVIQAILLGIVQGLTEFLPISSSAHLVIVPYLLGWQIPISEAFVFDVLVQLGTLAAVILFFARDLWDIIREWLQGILHRSPFGTFNARLGWFLIIATIPAGLLGITIKSQVEAVFNSPVMTAALLYGTAILLLIAERVGKRSREMQSMHWVDAVWIGAFQAISIFPGISRSGATISGGMTRNLDRPSAARFSFLMSIPVMLAAGLIGLLDLRKIPGVTSFLPIMAIGFLTAGVVGYFCIRWLLRYVSRRSFYPFIIYCAVFATLVIAYSLLNKPPATLATNENPALVRIGVSPELTWMIPLIDLCSKQQPGLNLVAQEEANPANGGSDFNFQIDGNTATQKKAIILGMDTIQFIVNKSNPISTFNLESIISLLQGTISSWPNGTAVNLYAYPPDRELMKSVITFVPLQKGFSPASQIVFHPQDILQKIRSDPSGLGFIPASLLDDSVKPLEIASSTDLDQKFRFIVVFDRELSGNEKAWLACIQKGIKNQ
jgi:undecaprenyl-diphosphatase